MNNIQTKVHYTERIYRKNFLWLQIARFFNERVNVKTKRPEIGDC